MGILNLILRICYAMSLKACGWGNPPRWVEKFKCSKCLILSQVSEYFGTGRTGVHEVRCFSTNIQL
uniref:Uncharacterized protein n=1 Tax=Kalanchoe fedtschenkoi TaxID=63787 RepID=A0A7N0TVT4_KALFE